MKGKKENGNRRFAAHGLNRRYPKAGEEQTRKINYFAPTLVLVLGGYCYM